MSQFRPLPWHRQQWTDIQAAITQGRLAHALLLVGPSGIGKRHFVAVLANSILCARPDASGLPCGTCQPCQLVQANTHPDLLRLEKEEGSKVVKVDDLREFNRKIFQTSRLGHGVVGIVDPADRLNRSSENALLKCLEEPPYGVHMLLVGERWMGLPATIRSRCSIMHFPLPDEAAVRQWLETETSHSETTRTIRERYVPDTNKRQGWLNDLSAVCLDRHDPIQLAEQWQKLDEGLPELLDWLHSCTADLIKVKSNVPDAALSNRGLVKQLKVIAARLPLTALHALSARGVETRRLLQQSQARPQMLLENLLASWYQDARLGTNAGHHASGAGSP